MAIQKEIRPVAAFREVEIQGYGEIRLEKIAPGAGAVNRLEIEADEEFLPKLKAEVRGNRLILSYDLAWNEWITWWLNYSTVPDKSVRYTVRMETLEGLWLSGSTTLQGPEFEGEQIKIHTSGSSKVNLQGLRSESLFLKTSGAARLEIPQLHTKSTQIEISGSGEVALAGSSPRVDIQLSGSGHVWVENLEAEQVNISLSGAGSGKVFARQELSIKISGAGEVLYKGQPKLTQRISGAGRVRSF